MSCTDVVTQYLSATLFLVFLVLLVVGGILYFDGRRPRTLLPSGVALLMFLTSLLK